MAFPGGDLVTGDLNVAESASQALAGQNRQFAFGQYTLSRSYAGILWLSCIAVCTQSDLWGGPGVKQEHAFYFWRRMQHALEPPPRTQINVAMQSAGTIIGWTGSSPSMPNFDAFLAMARSVPEIINVCFGYEDRAPKPIRDWFDALDPGEQQRRKEFTKQFAAWYGAFRALPLSNKRNVTFHRTGVSGVKVTIVARFGIYTGSATEPVPQAESLPIPSGADPNVPWPALIGPTALEPK